MKSDWRKLIDVNNEEQVEWAFVYLKSKTSYLVSVRHYELFDKAKTIQKVFSQIENSEATTNSLIKRMREAWHQRLRRRKHLLDDNGRKTCTYMLLASTQTKLRWLAENKSMQITDMLESLICKSYERTVRSKKSMQMNNDFALRPSSKQGLGYLNTNGTQGSQ